MFRIALNIRNALTEEEKAIGCVDPAFCDDKARDLVDEYAAKFEEQLDLEARHLLPNSPVRNSYVPPYPDDDAFPEDPLKDIGPAPIKIKPAPGQEVIWPEDQKR
jgi:hypothetical protein